MAFNLDGCIGCESTYSILPSLFQPDANQSWDGARFVDGGASLCAYTIDFFLLEMILSWGRVAQASYRMKIITKAVSFRTSEGLLQSRLYCRSI